MNTSKLGGLARMLLTPLVIVGLLGAFAPAHATDAKKPNILVIWGDDIGT